MRKVIDISSRKASEAFIEKIKKSLAEDFKKANIYEHDVIDYSAEKIAAETVGFDSVVADSIAELLAVIDSVKLSKSAIKKGLIERVKLKKKELEYKQAMEKIKNNKHVDLSDSLPPNFFNGNDIYTDGTIKSTTDALDVMLVNYGVIARYNEAIKLQEVIFPKSDNLPHDLRAESDIQKLKSLALRCNFKRDSVVERLPAILEKNTYNPVKDWILSVHWDGQYRITELFETLKVSPENYDLSLYIFRTWLIQCIAALDKGVIGCSLNSFAVPKFELCLVLQGIQGAQKTRWFGSLLPFEVNGERFSSKYIIDGASLDLRSKDSIKQNTSCWINELGELDSTISKNDVGMLKAFLSKQKDVMRLPYARAECEFQRSTSFGASVNNVNFLADATGSRRFGVIAVESINSEHLIDMQQLWREVWDLYATGEKWWLNKLAESDMQVRNLQHTLINPVEDKIMTCFNWGEPESLWVNRMTMSQIYEHCYPNSSKPTRGEVNTMLDFLEKKVKIVRPKNMVTALMPSKVT